MSQDKDLYHRYRAVGAKKIAKLFYQKHDLSRNYGKTYKLFIRPLYGICEDTFRNYRNEPDESLKMYARPLYIENSEWFMVITVKEMGVRESNRFFELFKSGFSTAIKRARKENTHKKLKSETVIRSMLTSFEEILVQIR